MNPDGPASGVGTWLPPRAPSGFGRLARPGLIRLQPLLVAALFVAYACAHGVLHFLAAMLHFGPEHLITILPATGLLLAVLLVTPRRSWPFWIVAAVVAEATVGLVLPAGASIGQAIVAGAVRALAALVTALAVAGAIVRALRFRRPLYLFITLTVGAAFASVLAGLANAALLGVMGDPQRMLLLWRLESFAIFLGIVFGAPLVLAWTVGPRRTDERSLLRRIELLALLAFSLALTLVYLFLDPAAQMPYLAEVRFSLYPLLVLPCLWAALRFDMRVLSAVLFVTAVVVVWGAGAGRGPFAFEALQDVQLLSRVQWYLLAVGVLVWLLHCAMLERARAYEDVAAHVSVSDVLARIATKFAERDREGLDATIEDSLRDITRFTNADRCSLAEFDREAGTYSETHTWVRPERPAQTPRREGTLEQVAWAIERLERDGQFVIPDLAEDLPKGARFFQTLLADQRTSVAYVALRVDEEIIGAMGFEWAAGQFHWSRETIALLRIAGQLFASMLRRRQAAETVSAYQTKLRSMARELSLSDERARRRTATDLHDGIGQNLAVTKIRLGQLAARADADQAHHFEVLQELVEDALLQSRNIIADLSPSILFDLGFTAAVRWQAARTEQVHDGVKCSVNETGEPWNVGEDSAIAIFRCVRELVQNSVRHSGGDRVSVHVDWRTDDLHVCVSDNGSGFSSEEALRGELDEEGHGFGLFSLRETVHVLGGEMIIDSSPGEGAAVSFAVLRARAGS